MNKQEAIQAMIDGKKVTHNHFSTNEWMTIKYGKIVLEDGVICPPAEFWEWRQDESWNDGYSLFEEITEEKKCEQCSKVLEVFEQMNTICDRCKYVY